MVALLAVLAAPSTAAAAVTIGPAGSDSGPGVAVDAAGTAYIAWGGPENPASLQFCRLPRGATACDSRHAIGAPGTTGHRAFVLVSGSRVVVAQYRYPNGAAPNDPAGMYAFTSNDRGVNFGAGRRLGPLPFFEAAPGPGDTLSGVTAADARGTAFQNVPLGGSGGGSEEFATLSTDHPYVGTVGLIDAGTPLAVFADGGGGAQFSRYRGTGSLNQAGSWTAPVSFGAVSYPKLASGPSGLVLVSTADGATDTIFARKWNGTTFGPPATVIPGNAGATLHAFQDPGGRIHAVFVPSSANPLRLVHAVSDDGTTWRSGTVLKQDIADAAGIADTRVATAADHIGVVAWNAGRREIRVAAVGPDAPTADRYPRRKPGLNAHGSAKRGQEVDVELAGKLKLPAGVSKADGCAGKIKIAISRRKKVISRKATAVRPACGFDRKISLPISKVRTAAKLGVTFRFRGNDVLRPVKKRISVAVR